MSLAFRGTRKLWKLTLAYKGATCSGKSNYKGDQFHEVVLGYQRQRV